MYKVCITSVCRFAVNDYLMWYIIDFCTYTAVLSQDIRGLNQGRGTATHIPLDALLAMVEKNKDTAPIVEYEEGVVNIHEEDIMGYIIDNNINDKHVVYVCNLDIMHIKFITTDNTIIVLKIVKES